MMARRLTLTVLVLIVAAAATTASARRVYVSSRASGCFGNGDGGCKPLVTALAASGPGTITTRAWGKVNFGPGVAGPNGVPECYSDWQQPLQEAKGIAHGCIKHGAALIGVFIPQSWVQQQGFQALDATKNLAQVGVKPGWLFFVGKDKKFQVKEAGTLFLGINDSGVDDNSGGFHVNVTFTAR